MVNGHILMFDYQKICSKSRSLLYYFREYSHVFLAKPLQLQPAKENP